MDISVVMLNKDGETKLPRALKSLRSFDEVILCDTGSTDKSLAVAKKFPNVKIIQQPFNGFGRLRNTASIFASNDWIFVLDSDERVTEELLDELESLTCDPALVYSMPFHNYFNGKWIKTCGWYPDRHVRLYNRKHTQFKESAVHEGIDIQGLRVQKLQGPIEHFSYENTDDFLRKMDHYSTLFADQYAGKKRSSFKKALLRGGYAFFKSYILKRGFMQGREGYIISAYNGQTTYYKYLKLAERS